MKRLLGCIALAAVLGALIGRVGVLLLAPVSGEHGDRGGLYLSVLTHLLCDRATDALDVSGACFTAKGPDLDEPLEERARIPAARSVLSTPPASVQPIRARPGSIPAPPRYYLYCVLRT